MVRDVADELKRHAPFTAIGTASGVVIVLLLVFANVPRGVSTTLFHMAMAMGSNIRPLTVAAMALFLFLAVWVPCCTSDIVFPLLWVRKNKRAVEGSAA